MAARLLVLDSVEALVQHRDAWNDLWQHSDVASPLARAESIALWVHTFASAQPFRALVAEHEGTFLAALPVVGQRLGPGLTVATIPDNEWSPAGELLVRRSDTDPMASLGAKRCQTETAVATSANPADAQDLVIPQQLEPDAEMALSILAGGLRSLPWSMLWTEGTPLDAPRWRTFLRLAGTRRLPHHERFSYDAGVVDTTGSFEAYFRTLSKNFQRNVRRGLKRLGEMGSLSLRIEHQLDVAVVADQLRQGFAVEDRNWKGRSGTSVLRTPGMLEFFTRQAENLAANGNLVLIFLELDGHPIAFEYALSAAGVHHSFKIGYDESFSRCSPGQVRTYLLLEQLFADPATEMLDFMGPIAACGRHWMTGQYRVGKFALATRPFTGGALVWGYGQLWPRVRTWLGRRDWNNGSKGDADSATDDVAGTVAT